MRLAILDDYLGLGRKIVDWKQIPDLAVVSFQDHVYTEDELIDRLSDFDFVMRIRERTEFPGHVLSRLPKLKLILATGLRNARSIDLKATDKLGITVCATEANHGSTVEVAWALLLNLFRGIVQENKSLQAGGWQTHLGRGLDGKTLGIIGLGNMGIPVAKIGLAFGMRVVAWSRNLTRERASLQSVQAVTKQALFEQSDAITIHMPLNEGTLGLVGREDLARMKPDAFLVNTSRAQIIDEIALLEALRARRIGGAGLDVFDIEPLPLAHEYRWLPNVLATPHIGFVTQENMEQFFYTSFQNLRNFLAGIPTNVITNDRPYLADSALGKAMHG